ncbi:5-oxoprolinase subunit PxpA [Marinoscillum furvescens]|uniref:UPF0271 protein n=1 Tax=Marinoscillum furvescens DSM 4134 TaxID=1122208 RepID=A0A3D9KXY4_MARFU|nr:5-oxoprolinase subunit PxpA [Marinoscillum furvescens]RED91745.1 UPF0271 protein [Marinoscillum furvescens DSM 4134]
MWLINSDVGEGTGNDIALMPHLDLCSIACGGHIGDENSIRSTIRLAVKHGVKIGAHPSYPDPENFGRKSLDISKSELEASLNEQLQQIAKVCQEENTSLHHIKAHGALYHDISNDLDIARLFLNSTKVYSTSVLLLPPVGHGIALAKATNRAVMIEAFADRRYDASGNLLARSMAGAVISSAQDALQQIEQIALTRTVTANTGEEIPMTGETFCVHGDNPACVAIAKHLHQTKYG